MYRKTTLILNYLRIYQAPTLTDFCRSGDPFSDMSFLLSTISSWVSWNRERTYNRIEVDCKFNSNGFSSPDN